MSKSRKTPVATFDDDDRTAPGIEQEESEGAVDVPSDDVDDANLLLLANIAGGEPGFFRHAYTIVTLESGRMIPVRLENVVAESAHVADPLGIHKRLVPEVRRDAMKRVLRGIKHRTMSRYDGWK